MFNMLYNQANLFLDLGIKNIYTFFIYQYAYHSFNLELYWHLYNGKNVLKEDFFYMAMHSTQFLYSYMVLNICLRTTQIKRGNPLPILYGRLFLISNKEYFNPLPLLHGLLFLISSKIFYNPLLLLHGLLYFMGYSIWLAAKDFYNPLSLFHGLLFLISGKGFYNPLPLLHGLLYFMGCSTSWAVLLHGLLFLVSSKGLFLIHYPYFTGCSFWLAANDFIMYTILQTG